MSATSSPCDNSFQNGSINPGIISGFVGDTFGLESIETDIDCNEQVTCTYSVGSGQGLYYSSSDESVVTISGNTATLLDGGSANIRANWDAFTVQTHCFLSAEGECVDATCNSRPVSKQRLQ